MSVNVLPPNWSGSTYLTNSIVSYDTLAQRVMAELGHPYIDVDVTDAQMAMFIDNSIAFFSRYVTGVGENEYFLFFDSDIDQDCGIRLDAAIHSCEVSAACAQSYWTEVVTATETTETSLYTGLGLLSAHSVGFVVDNTGVPINEQVSIVPLTAYGYLTFDSANPWSADVCDATHISVSALETYPETEIFSPILTACISISDRMGQLLPCDWESKDRCDPLSTWWDVGEGDAPDFDPTEATHLRFYNVPDCWVTEYSPISYNNGYGVTFNVCLSSVDTRGDIPVEVQFVRYHELPPVLEGLHELNVNGGLRMGWNEVDTCYQNTTENISVSAEFLQITTIESTGLSSVSVPYAEEDARPRKVTGVFNVTHDNQYTSYTGSILFNFEYALMSGVIGNIGGWNQGGSNMNLVTYDLLSQFLELTGKMFMTERVSYAFNPHTQVLRIIKPKQTYSTSGSRGYIIGVNRERPIEQYMKEPWIKDHVRSQVMIAAGNALTKFSGIQLPGGATVNGSDILSRGQAEKDKLEEYLRTTLDYGTGPSIYFA